MKIGIFGGSFNPPHNMHKNIGLELIKNNYVDKVIYVPTGNYYPKEGLVMGEKRLEMLKIMLADYNNMEVDDYEVKNRLVYTYQTLNYFKDKFYGADLYFICGTDNLKELSTWKNYQYIIDNFKFIIIRRNGDKVEEILDRYGFDRDKFIVANIEEDYISSTDVRNNIRCRVKKLTRQMDNNVLKYIEKEGLYS